MIDLRSDTVTQPTPEMYRAIASAALGDDVYDGDPTTRALERGVAELLGQETGLFCSSGTQANLLAILTHCRRGEEFISGDIYHALRFEGGGAAALAGVSSQAVPVSPDGSLDLALVASAVKSDDIHFAPTRLLCLENTVSGRPIAVDYLRAALALCRNLELRSHLDGARLLNASVYTHTSAADFGSLFDSVTLCLSKGLSAPAGTVLAGPREFIEQARRWRKTLGGGMRQSGVLAACGLVSLTHYQQWLRLDHENASFLASALAQLEEITLEFDGAQTNMVHASVDQRHHTAIIEFMRRNGILIGGRAPRFRFVLHREVSQKDLMLVLSCLKDYFASAAAIPA